MAFGRQGCSERDQEVSLGAGVDEAHTISIISKYTDKSFSYADATSFAVMERLGIRRAFAFDPHFRQYGFRVVGLPPS